MDRIVAEAIADVIDAIDSPAFADVMAKAVARMVPSHLFSLVIHRHGHEPELLHDNFSTDEDWRSGLGLYLESTFHADPFVIACGSGVHPEVYRLRSLAQRWQTSPRYGVFAAPKEETGYRTPGWPPEMEEVGIGLPLGFGRIAHLALYRPVDCRNAFTDSELERLNDLRFPLAAAFRRFERRRIYSRRSALENLSYREQQVAINLSNGLSTCSVAEKLGISADTVKTHRKNIYRKLQVSSLAELVIIISYEDSNKYQ